MPEYLKTLSPAPLSDCEGAASFLQSRFWAEFKAAFAWTPFSFNAVWRVDGGPAESRPLLALYRTLAFGAGFAYVPWGPELPGHFPGDDAAKTTALRELALSLRPLLPRKTAFIRFDPPWSNAGTEGEAPAVFKPFSRASADIQPPDTVILDLKAPHEAILAQMKAKWRYNVRLGGKKTAVSRADFAGLDTFYTLFKETSLRDGIAIHGIGYYRRLFELASKHNADVRLYLAEAEGEALAGIITLFRGKTATYLYGASSNGKRNLMPAHALQWRAICDAKEAGCEEYDFFGIAPNDDPSHPMHGLYSFKTGFGGTIIHRPGSYDYPYRRIVTTLFACAEKLRKKIRDRRKRR
jgi:lipid II:glycine glycyltransferase (peptidoglycan interpeptide bridge formation enzyme)